EGVGSEAVRVDTYVDDPALFQEHGIIGSEDLPPLAGIRAQLEAATAAELGVEGRLGEVGPPEQSVLLQRQFGAVPPGLTVEVRPGPVEFCHGLAIGFGDVVAGD